MTNATRKHATATASQALAPTALDCDGAGVARPNFRGWHLSICVVVSPRVVELEVCEPFQIWVRFDDGIAGVVDLSDSAAVGGIFAQWSDEGFWRSAHIVADCGAVAWGDGSEIDVCPLSLYLDVTGLTFERTASRGHHRRS